ncbi:MAG: amidohydrolase [Acidimicrobiia bacterium]|nr:amidohydrolase [Acidimicrobiia bacterium]MDH3398562.1 amidohydrolase [Acidimicrobiia bacterium]
MTTRLVVGDRIRTSSGILGDAILIRDGRVAATGRIADLRRPDLLEDRYPGCVIIPGLRDAHMHPVPYTLSLLRPTLKNATNLDVVLERVRAAAGLLAAGEPLIAIRIDDEGLSELRLPTRHELDLAVDNRPVLVYRYCGHVAVANTRALEVAGISSVAADPVGGSLDRDRFGVPNGILRETAIEPVATALSGWAVGPDPEAVLSALHGLTTLGLTSLGAILAVGTGPWCGSGNELETMITIVKRLPLKLTVLVIAGDSAELEQAAAALDGTEPRLRFLGVKEFADGSLGGHTAAMGSPYADQPDAYGTLRLDPRAVSDRARTALRLGGKVAVHAIGDVANARVLDLFDELLADGADPADLRVEHASILDPDLIARFAGSGVTASVQPAFMTSEAAWLEKRLGPDRLAHAYPLASLASAGVPLAGGSDCPVEAPHPLWGMAAARDRGGLVPEEALSAAQALSLFTDDAARAMGEAKPLAIGSPADFAVLDRDPVEATPEELRRARVLATWIDGEAVPFPKEAVTWRG